MRVHMRTAIPQQARALPLLLSLLLCMLLAPAAYARDPSWALPLHVDGLPNFHKVSEHLYRSGQPTAEGFRNAEAAGIRSVLNLRELHSDKRPTRGTALTLVEVPVATGSMSEQDVIAALRAINESPGPVLVHCMHGADRTGTVVAFYRILFQGWSREEAKQEMTEGGFGYHSLWSNLPRLIDTADLNAMRLAVFGTTKEEIRHSTEHFSESGGRYLTRE